MKKIDIKITPALRGSTVKIDEQEVRGTSKIELSIIADASDRTPKIFLEFQGHKLDAEGNLMLVKTENGEKILDEFSHRIKGYSISISVSGEFNEYPFTSGV